MSAEETSVELGPAREGAQQVVDAVANSRGQVEGLLARIEAACAAKPWGSDAAGDAGDSALTSIGTQLPRVKTHLAALSKVGDILVGAVTRTEAADDAVGGQIEQSAVTALATVGQGLRSGGDPARPANGVEPGDGREVEPPSRPEVRARPVAL
ncbi:MAG: hypothetical protein ACQSGP_19170 [Frankia sp.]